MSGVPTRSRFTFRPKRPRWRLWAFSLSLFLSTVHAQPVDGGHSVTSASRAQAATYTCATGVTDWARTCARRQSLAIETLNCPTQGIALIDLAGSQPLRVELRRADARVFRRVGSWGLSPVGDFADWSRVAPELRDHLDRLTVCVQGDTSFAQGLDRPRTAGPRLGTGAAHAVLSDPTFFNSLPWLLFGAVLCLFFARGHERLREDFSALRRLHNTAPWPYFALGIGTFITRTVLFTAGYFHQNGQGPLWVSSAIAPQFMPYGPGFRSLFGWVRWVAPRHPDTAIFTAQNALCALGPPAGFFIARRLGARVPLALALALALALDPVLGRLARSESYYGSLSALLLVACAIVTALTAQHTWRNREFFPTLLAAGMVIAQAALVHPIAWVAAALTPLPLLLTQNPLKTRLGRTLTAALTIALTVALFSAPTLFAIFHSSLGAQWINPSAPSFLLPQRLLSAAPPSLFFAALAFATTRSPLHTTLTALTAYLTIATLLITDLVGYGATFPWVHQAYLRLYAFAFVALIASTLSPAPRNRTRSILLGSAVFALFSIIAITHRHLWLQRPTDSLTASRALSWRDRLPYGASIAWVERVGHRVEILPFYRYYSPLGLEPIPLRQSQDLTNLHRAGRQTYYFRSALCSTTDGRPLCTAIEHRYILTPIATATLPAVPSMVLLNYASSTVSVGLYRITGLRQTP